MVYENVYKTVENFNSSIKKVDGATNKNSRRYFNYGNFDRVIDNGSRLSDVSSTKFPFLDKHEEISFETMSNFKVSRCGNKFI